MVWWCSGGGLVLVWGWSGGWAGGGSVWLIMEMVGSLVAPYKGLEVVWWRSGGVLRVVWGWSGEWSGGGLVVVWGGPRFCWICFCMLLEFLQISLEFRFLFCIIYGGELRALWNLLFVYKIQKLFKDMALGVGPKPMGWDLYCSRNFFKFVNLYNTTYETSIHIRKSQRFQTQIQTSPQTHSFKYTTFCPKQLQNYCVYFVRGVG